LVEKPGGKGPFESRRLTWEDNIKMDLYEVEWGRDIDWIDLAQNRDTWQAVTNAVMNLRVS